MDYWNNIDSQLELDIDVIDDHMGDAREVMSMYHLMIPIANHRIAIVDKVNLKNGWLTYGAPIHRMREFGASMKEMDIIDESTLSSEQMRVICGYL